MQCNARLLHENVFKHGFDLLVFGAYWHNDQSINIKY